MNELNDLSYAGWIKKEEPLENVVSIIRSVFTDNIDLYKNISDEKSNEEEIVIEPYQITKREYEILCLLTSGKTNAQISSELGISERTVEFHITNIYKKVNVSSRVELSNWASENSYGQNDP